MPDFEGQRAQFLPKVFAHHAINDKVSRGVDGQEEVVSVGEKVDDDRHVVATLIVAILEMVIDGRLRMRHFVNAKDEPMDVAKHEDDDDEG